MKFSEHDRFVERINRANQGIPVYKNVYILALLTFMKFLIKHNFLADNIVAKDFLKSF